MPGLMLFENILDNGTRVAAESSTEQSGFEHVNAVDGRRDTAAKFDTLCFDLKGADQSAGSSSAYTTTQVTLANAERKPFGYWVGYTFELTSGPHSGESTLITEYDHTTNVATFDTPLSGSGSGTYTLTLTPDFDAVGIAAHNLSSFNGAEQLTVRTGAVQGVYTSTEVISDIVSNDVYLRQFLTLQSNRYVQFEVSSGSGEGFVSILYLGQSMSLGADFDEFALRAPFSPPGMMQTLERTGARNNNGHYLPASYRDAPFPVDLNFKHLDADLLRQQLHRGMYDLIQKQPFFIGWDVTNFGHADDYHEAAICHAERTIAPPRLPDFNGRFDWTISAQGFKR